MQPQHQHMTSPEVPLKRIVYRDEHAIRHQTTVIDCKPQYSFPVFSSRPAGNGPVCTNENRAVMFSWAKAGDHQNSLLQLLPSEVEALEQRDFQAFRNEAVKPISPSNLHFLGAPVSLPHMCHRLFSSNQHQLPRNMSCIFQKLRCQQARPPN